jgi:glycerol uptake facilitator-like aquaporin
MNSGYAINPARDLPPRIFTWFIYGGEVWTAAHHWSWIPTIVPFFGAALGSLVYTLATL